MTSKRNLSREYLEEALAEARKWMPGWAWAMLHRSAFPRSGARARHQRQPDEPGPFAKIALAQIRPTTLRKLPDDELRLAWLRVNQWFANAQKRKRSTENFVNAAAWLLDEFERREFEVEPSELVRQAEKLRALRKERRQSVEGERGELPERLAELLAKQPDEIMVVRDFAAVAGSAAVTEKPGDIDVVIRAELDGDEKHFKLDGVSLGVALRRFLAPDKDGPQVQLIGAPQGSFTDYVPIYDLVARKRNPHVEKIEAEPPGYSGQGRVVKASGKPYESVGFFLPLPPDLALQFPPEGKAGEDDSPPHLTLLYLGDVKPEQATKLRNVARVVFAEACPLQLSLAPVASFKNKEGQTIRHCPVIGSGLRDLHTRLKHAMTAAGVESKSDYREYKPHVTIEYVDAGKQPRLKVRPVGTWIASECELWGLPRKTRLELGSLRKQARAAEPEQRRQAARAEREDKLRLGEFFFQPKPTRPAFAEELQTVDRLVSFFREGTFELPTFVQKKYDGVRHQIHKDGDKVTIYSEDGDDNTDRLPGVVAAVRKLKPKSLVLDAELERWQDGQHLPREATSGYLAEKGEADDAGAGVVANVFDVLFVDGEDVHAEPTHERLARLGKVGIAQSTMGKPGLEQRLNLAPSEKLHKLGELRPAVERIRKLPGSEGIVAKHADAPFPLEPAAQNTWVKFHNATTVRGIVTGSKRTKGGAWVHSYGIELGDVTPAEPVRVGARELVPVGDSFSTSRSFKKGAPILIEAETLNLIREPDGVRVTAWVPRVIGTYEGKPDTVRNAAARARANLVLQVKEVDEAGEVRYLPPGEGLRKAARGRVQVPTKGPKGAQIAFVGASPGKMEAARREPFVGATRETLAEVYLEPLGVPPGKVLLTNAVPRLLTRADGSVRQPTVEEIKAWRDWLEAELDAKQPKIVVALGRTAESALGDRADFTLPHPSAVRRFGDVRGELKRKLRQLKRRLAKAAEVAKQIPKPLLRPREEGGTRSTRAFDNWERNWHTMLPTSGKGRFSYQHHWRGLDPEEDETKLSDEQLMHEPRSIHGDLRLEADDALWGWAMFLGRTADNRDKKLNDKLIDWTPGDKIELAPKLPQPKAWLKAGADKPLVFGPGELGEPGEKSSKFFGLDEGTYELGVARKHAVEIFLDGKHLKGRYLFQFAPVGGRRRWLVDKPEDQTPKAERRDLADEIGELRTKRQRFLIWAKPGVRPQKIDVRTGRVVKQAPSRVAITKTDGDKQIAYGVVLDPYQFDAHGDWTPPADIEATAHEWQRNGAKLSLRHEGPLAEAYTVETFVEPYPSRGDYLKALRNEPHRAYRRKFGGDTIHSGAWVVGVKCGDREWADVERGELDAFSIEGWGARTPVSAKAMPKVTYVDLVVAGEAPSR